MAATMLIYANSSIKGRKYEVKQTFIPGMHRAALFCFGAGQKKFFGVGRDRAGQLVKSSGRGRVTVKLAAFSGRVEAVLIIFGAGQPFFPGSWRGGAGSASPV